MSGTRPPYSSESVDYNNVDFKYIQSLQHLGHLLIEYNIWHMQVCYPVGGDHHSRLLRISFHVWLLAHHILMEM